MKPPAQPVSPDATQRAARWSQRVWSRGRQGVDHLGRLMAVWWAKHARHERWLLAGCAGLTALALLWTMVLRPSLDRLSAARAQLPVLQQDMAQIQAIVREAALLQRGRNATVHVAQVIEELNMSLGHAGLVESVTVTQDDEAQRWRVTVQGASAARVIDWLAGLPFLVQVRTVSVTLERAQVDGRARPGVVSGQIVLARAEQAR